MRSDILAKNRALLEAAGCDAEAIAAAEAVVLAQGDDEAVARVFAREWVTLPSAEVAMTVARGTLMDPDHCAAVVQTTDDDGTVRTFLVLPKAAA